MQNVSFEEIPVVLLVDDDALILMLLDEIVSDAGFDSLVAPNAADAIEILIARHDIRILFTDVDMPGAIDGLDLAHIVRQRWIRTQVIIASGNPISYVDLPMGSTFFLKPYNINEVIKLFRNNIAWMPPLAS